MPVYQCVTAGVDLTDDQRERIAHGITTIHHDETQAPEPFIRVAFEPLPLGLMYTAGKIEPSIIITGGIRYGRGEAVRRRIMDRLHQLAVEVTGSPEDQVLIVVQDVPNAWAMEAGIVMPEPTAEAEAEWARQLAEKLPHRFAGQPAGATA